MKLAFCLFNYFPYGGLQRDFMRIAQLCQQRGHIIDVYTQKWEGEISPGFNLILIPYSGKTNHARATAFGKKLGEYLKRTTYDTVIGFNRLPHLDIYYAADPCYQAFIHNERSFLYQFTPRYQQYLALEKAVFSPSANTKILIPTSSEQDKFMHYYSTPAHRFYLIPPGVEKDQQSAHDNIIIRNKTRQMLGVTPEQHLVLMVATYFKTKGVDRALRAVASLPPALLSKTQLMIIGQDKQKPFLQLARQLGIEKQVTFLGARDDVLSFLKSADLLLHPAYTEAGGKVLLEALVAGLPVLATAHCGYAFHIEKAQAGLLTPHPFHQEQLNSQLHQMLISPQQASWKQNALDYAAQTDLYSLHEKAVAIIEHSKT